MLDADELMYAEDKIAAQAAEIARLNEAIALLIDEAKATHAEAVTVAEENDTLRAALTQARAERDALAAALREAAIDEHLRHVKAPDGEWKQIMLDQCMLRPCVRATRALTSMETGHE